MAFGIFIHRADSIYDDSPSEQYQFPKQYLGRVQACAGDWVIYYEPRKASAARGYFAVAKVAQVIQDPKAPAMYVALIEPGSYLDFINPVPFNGPAGVIESGVLNEAGRISGRAQAAVRPVSASDFNRILSIGLEERGLELPRIGEPSVPGYGFGDGPQTPFVFDQERDRISHFLRVLSVIGCFGASFSKLMTNDVPSPD